MKNRVFFIFIFFFSLQTRGQDLHHTNTRYSPLYVNPALTGNFLGNIRLGAIYRDQGRHLLYQGFETINLFVDAAISTSFRQNDWIGAGIQVYSDKVGYLSLVTQGLIANFAYHFAFDKKYKNVLSLGIQYGTFQKKIDDSKIILESDTYDPGVQLRDRQRLINYRANYNDINIGINYRAKLSKTNLFVIGVATHHLLESKYEGITGNNFVDRRFTFHISLVTKINKLISIKPEITASLSENSLDVIPQFKAFYKLKKVKNDQDLIYMGLGYRVLDALQVMFGMQYEKWDIGFAYDITISSAAPLNKGRGGFEIGVFRVFQIYKKPKIIPVLLCPEL